MAYSKTATSEPAGVTVFDQDVERNHFCPGILVPQLLPRLLFWQIKNFLGSCVDRHRGCYNRKGEVAVAWPGEQAASVSLISPDHVSKPHTPYHPYQGH